MDRKFRSSHLGVRLILINLESLDTDPRQLRRQRVAPAFSPLIRLDSWCDGEDGSKVGHGVKGEFEQERKRIRSDALTIMSSEETVVRREVCWRNERMQIVELS